MKKIVPFLTALFVCSMLTAQVAVTFQVDVTNYIAGGNTIDASGMRIAGNFSGRQGTAAGSPMPDWSPSVPSCSMTAQANNVWQCVVTFPNNVIGQQLQYIFVNGNFGAQEGLSPNNEFVSEGCGMIASVQGAPFTVRTLNIPQIATTKLFCFDSCYSCAGSGVGINEINVSDLNVSPNPSADNVTFSFATNASQVEIALYDLMGKKVSSRAFETTALNVVDFSLAHLQAGTYVYKVTAAGNVVTGKLLKK
jgi:hypothetical protein